MKVIGITGNSGSGKSFISSILKEYEGFIIDADKIGHDVLEKGMYAYNEVIDTFGHCILDENSNINRKSLGAIVFNDKSKLAELNKITHKYITKVITHKVNEIKLNSLYKFIVIDAALLIEAGLHKVCDIIILVDANKDIRLRRIMERDEISEEEAKSRIDSQTSSEYLKRYAHIIIINDKFNTLLKEDVKSLLKEIL